MGQGKPSFTRMLFLQHLLEMDAVAGTGNERKEIRFNKTMWFEWIANQISLQQKCYLEERCLGACKAK